jgi:transcription elongation factor Elf1
MDRDFKGIWIPKEIWCNPNLKMIEKLFLVEINSLDNEDGCFASNDYFADFFGLSADRCSKIISSLVDKKLLTRTTDDQKQIRILKTATTPLVKFNYGISDSLTLFSNLDNSNTLENDNKEKIKSKEGIKNEKELKNDTIGENNYPPIVENAEHNNIYINNKEEKININIFIKKKVKKLEYQLPKSFDCPEFENALEAFVNMRTTIKKPLTEYGLQLVIKQLTNKTDGDVSKAIETLNKSIINSWQGLFFETKESGNLNSQNANNGKIETNSFSNNELKKTVMSLTDRWQILKLVKQKHNNCHLGYIECHIRESSMPVNDNWHYYNICCNLAEQKQFQEVKDNRNSSDNIIQAKEVPNSVKDQIESLFKRI